MESSSRTIREPELLENLAWVQALARRLVTDQAEADDVAQDAMVVALERPPRWTSIGGLRGWLARVTRSMARQRHRADTARRLREEAASPARVAPSAFDVVARTAMQQRIVGAVMELEEPDRTTVLLRHVDGLSARAIADRRGEEAAAVRQRLSRARAKLRGRLERELGDDGLRALVPLAFAGAGKTVLPVLGTLGGGALVTKTTLAIGVGTVVVVIGAVAWWSGNGDDIVPAAPPGDEADVALVDPEAVTEPVIPVEALAPVPDRGEPARVTVATEEELPGARYELLDPEGRTLADAHVELLAGTEGLASGVTDETGRFPTEIDRAGEGKLLVAAAGWAPQLHVVPLTAAHHEVVLREGGVVSGWIIEDGHTPRDVLKLRLNPDQSFLHLAEDVDRPPGTRTFMAEPFAYARTQTDAAGAFRIAGLPENWSGSLDLPAEYRLRDQREATSDYFVNRYRLEEAREGLRVEVVRHHVLSGRIVEFPAADAAPVPVEGVRVNPVLTYPPDAHLSRMSAYDRTGPDGRFRVPLRGLTITGGHLSLAPAHGEFTRSVPVGPLELTGDHDLGDIPLTDPEGVCALVLHVQSTDGDPIAGAVAGTDRESPISEPTDEEGSTLLKDLVPGESTITVYARGWEVTTAHVPVDAVDELVITMRRAATLELRFLRPDGESAGGVTARVWADVHPFRDEAPMVELSDAYRNAGLSWYKTVVPDDGTVVARVMGDRDGRAVLNDVRPGIATRLRVEGRFGATVHEQDLPPLAPGEWRVLDVDLPRGPVTLHGRVVDEAGEPLRSAHYMVGFQPPDSPSNMFMAVGTRVDENGEFRIPDIFQPTISLTVDADGYVEFRDEALDVPLDEAPIEFVLTSGRIVTVTLQDEEGRPLAGSVSCLLEEGGYAFGRAVVDAPGKYLVRGLPDREVVLVATVFDVPYEKTHDPLVPELTFTIPVHEDVTVTLAEVPDDFALEAEQYLILFPVDDPALSQRYRPLNPGFPGPYTIESVIPGRYEAFVARHRGVDEDPWEELTPHVPVVVAPDSPTSVTVEF